MTVTSVAVAATKFLFGMWDCAVDSDVGTGNFPPALGILYVCGHTHVRSLVSPGMDGVMSFKGLLPIKLLEKHNICFKDR